MKYSRKYLEDAYPSWFVFGKNLVIGTVDINDGTDDIFKNITVEQAKKVIIARDSFIESLNDIFQPKWKHGQLVEVMIDVVWGYEAVLTLCPNNKLWLKPTDETNLNNPNCQHYLEDAVNRHLVVTLK